MPVLNPGFEEAGERPEVGRYWRVRSSVRERAIAGFGTEPPLGVETFERWLALRTDVRPSQRAFFDLRPEGFEDFEQGWANDAFAKQWEQAVIEVASWLGRPIEDFELGWENVPRQSDWDRVDSSRADFGAQDVETFESRWRDNEGFVWAWGDARSSTARFTGGDRVETFEDDWSTATQI